MNQDDLARRRSEMRFCPAAIAAFGPIASDATMQLVHEGESRVRFESEASLLEIAHGRLSYEVQVEIGRPSRGAESDGRGYPLQSYVALFGGPGILDRAVTATTPAQVANVLTRMAGLTREYAMSALSGKGDAIDRVEAANALWSQSYIEGAKATLLRGQASRAWRSKDFNAVVDALSELEQLETVTLAQSEVGKLKYSRSMIEHSH